MILMTVQKLFCSVRGWRIWKFWRITSSAAVVDLTPRSEPAQQPITRVKEARLKPIWPEISKTVDIWEELVKDTRLVKRGCNVSGAKSPRHVLAEFFRNIPPSGAYVYSDTVEIYEDELMEARLNLNRTQPASVCAVMYGNKMVPSKEDQNILTHGVLLIQATKAVKLEPTFIARDEGWLYDVLLSHWSREAGHGITLKYQVVVGTGGKISPVWHWSTTHKVVRARRGNQVHHIPERRLVENGTLDRRLLRLLTWAFVAQQERDMHWNCRVSADSVPPLCFPVKDHDIARVFPRSQRSGDGKIVHWARAHARKTKAGTTVVRTHIRGSARFSIDGRQVSVTMPGKHHGLGAEMEAVSGRDLDHGRIIQDPVTKLCYNALEPSAMQRLLSRAWQRPQLAEAEA